MSEPFFGEIRMFGFDYAPQNWAFCNGSLLQIGQNKALFSLLYTTFGGDGITTFALPDLRGRVPIHFGTGPGLSYRQMGVAGGAETVTLPTSQLGDANGQQEVVVATSNGSAPSNMQPFLALNFCIALSGVYPTRPS